LKYKADVNQIKKEALQMLFASTLSLLDNFEQQQEKRFLAVMSPTTGAELITNVHCTL
jgi:molecular chaperone GrpE (heat shock protein)